MEVKIRPCEEKDLSRVDELQRKWIEEDITLGLAPASIEQLRAFMKDIFLLVEIGQQVVGYGIACIHLAQDMAVFDEGDRYIELEDVYLLPGYRKEGLGKKLVEELLGLGKEKGATWGLVYSATKDIRKMLTFYEGLGFQSWNIQMYF